MRDENWVGVTPAPPVSSESELGGIEYPKTCATEGHDFEMVVTLSGELLRIICARCGGTWKTMPI